MDELYLVRRAEELLVVAGAIMEDLDSEMVVGSRSADQVERGATRLLHATDELQNIARCVLVMLARARQRAGRTW